MPHLFALFANEWTLVFARALDPMALDFQPPLLKLYPYRRAARPSAFCLLQMLKSQLFEIH